MPTLKPGDIVVLDNLGSHKASAARQAIRRAGAKPIFLPPYSPDLNPIEQMFAKLKTLLRKADARTVVDTWKSIGNVLDAFSPAEYANCLRNSGYINRKLSGYSRHYPPILYQGNQPALSAGRCPTTIGTSRMWPLR